MIALSEQFGLWETFTDGSGSISYSGDGKIVNCSKTTGDRAYTWWRFLASGGSTIRASVLARNISGNGLITLESPLNTPVNRINVESETWRRYEIETTLPLYMQDLEAVFLFGTTTAEPDGSEVEFAKPRIEILGDYIAPSQTLAMGLVTISAGASSVSMPSNYRRFGFSSVTYDSGTKHIKFKLAGNKSFGGSNMLPLVFITPRDNGVTTVGVGPLIYHYYFVNNAGEFDVAATDLSGNIFDFSTSPVQLQFAIKVEM